MCMSTDITGVILAGGRSSRFGENKALVKFQGIPLIDRVINVMSPLFSDLLIVTNTPELYAARNLPVVADTEPYQGPLGGIFTALRHTSNDRVFVVGCDMPLLQPSIINQVIQAAGDADVAIPIHDGVREYLMALYSRRLLPEMCHALREGRRSLKEFCFKIANVEWIKITGDSYANINTKEDLRRWEDTHAV